MRVRDPRSPTGWRDEGPQAQYGGLLGQMARPEAASDLVSGAMDRQVSGEEPGAVRGWRKALDAAAVNKGLSRRRRCLHCQRVIPAHRNPRARYCSDFCRNRRYKHRPPVPAVRRCLRCGQELGSYKPQGTLYCSPRHAAAAWKDAHREQARATDRAYYRRKRATC